MIIRIIVVLRIYVVFRINGVLKIQHIEIVLDEWVIMPNHIHIIIVLRDYGFDNGISNIGGVVGQIHLSAPLKNHEFDLHCTPEQYRLYRRNMSRIEPVEMIIPKIMGKFKMLTSKYINIVRNTLGYKNWQNDYYDSTIKIDVNYPGVKQYIIDNPKKMKIAIKIVLTSTNICNFAL